MASRALNRSFEDAKKAKEDEFYTQLGDIERELHTTSLTSRTRLSTATATTPA